MVKSFTLGFFPSSLRGLLRFTPTHFVWGGEVLACVKKDGNVSTFCSPHPLFGKRIEKGGREKEHKWVRHTRGQTYLLDFLGVPIGGAIDGFDEEFAHLAVQCVPLNRHHNTVHCYHNGAQEEKVFHFYWNEKINKKKSIQMQHSSMLRKSGTNYGIIEKRMWCSKTVKR